MPAVQYVPLRPGLLALADQTTNTLWADRHAVPLVHSFPGTVAAHSDPHALHAVAIDPDDLKAATMQVLHAWSELPGVALGVMPGPEEALTQALTAQGPQWREPVEILSLGVASWHVWHDWSEQTPGERAWSVVKVGTQAAGLLCERVPLLHQIAPGGATVGLIVKIGGEAFALYKEAPFSNAL